MQLNAYLKRNKRVILIKKQNTLGFHGHLLPSFLFFRRRKDNTQKKNMSRERKKKNADV